MAKAGSINRNDRRKALVKKFAAKRAKLAAIANDENLPMDERFAARLKLAALPRNSAPIRVRNRCEVTGRPRGFYRKLKMSLIKEGYIRSFSELQVGNHTELSIELKYSEGTPVIEKITRVSKPGRRVYSSVKDLPLVRNGLGISILSTPKGVMSDATARVENVGGEILCQVY